MIQQHDCLANSHECPIDARWGHCTLTGIIPGVDNFKLLFQRVLFLRGHYDTDCDPCHYNTRDNRTDTLRYALGELTP